MAQKQRVKVEQATLTVSKYNRRPALRVDLLTDSGILSKTVNLNTSPKSKFSKLLRALELDFDIDLSIKEADYTESMKGRELEVYLVKRKNGWVDVEF